MTQIAGNLNQLLYGAFFANFLTKITPLKQNGSIHLVHIWFNIHLVLIVAILTSIDTAYLLKFEPNELTCSVVGCNASSKFWKK